MLMVCCWPSVSTVVSVPCPPLHLSVSVRRSAGLSDVSSFSACVESLALMTPGSHFPCLLLLFAVTCRAKSMRSLKLTRQCVRVWLLVRLSAFSLAARIRVAISAVMAGWSRSAVSRWAAVLSSYQLLCGPVICFRCEVRVEARFSPTSAVRSGVSATCHES